MEQSVNRKHQTKFSIFIKGNIFVCQTPFSRGRSLCPTLTSTPRRVGSKLGKNTFVLFHHLSVGVHIIYPRLIEHQSKIATKLVQNLKLVGIQVTLSGCVIVGRPHLRRDHNPSSPRLHWYFSNPFSANLFQTGANQFLANLRSEHKKRMFRSSYFAFLVLKHDKHG